MLHVNTISPTLLKIIRAVSADRLFEDFRLVGGTALSLHLGHRMSVDADFFSEKPFDKRDAEAALLHLLPGFLLMKESQHGFVGVFENVKIDLYTWNVPFMLPTVESEGIRLAAIPDIAALKLEAIIGRKEEKDFRDVHALLGRYSLSDLLAWYRERIPHRDLRLVIDHLAAAPAADRQGPMVLMRPVDYDVVAAEILASIRQYLADLKAAQTGAAEERLRLRLEALKNKKK